MKRIMSAVLAVMMLLTGCGKTRPTPTVPDTPVPPGRLIGVAYATGGGMMAGEDFQIHVNREEIEHTEFWPYEYADEITVLEHIPITQQQWADVEAVILDMYQDGAIEAYPVTSKPELPFMDAFILDGGDYTSFSLVWETEAGPVEIGCYWPSDRRVLTLTALLQELADPQGREIPRYESPRLDEIYFTRKYRLNNKRDFSFQLHYTAYDETDPHWELIYYLGKYGAVDNGHIRMEEAHWDAFLALAEQLQLEYFPEATRTDDFFTCQLSYSDEKYKHIVLNDETEEQLKQFFMNLINQEN